MEGDHVDFQRTQSRGFSNPTDEVEPWLFLPRLRRPRPRAIAASAVSPATRWTLSKRTWPAQRFIGVVRLKLGTAIKPGAVDVDTKTKVDNIFHVVLDTPDPFTEAARRTEIMSNVATLEGGLARSFPFQSEAHLNLGRAAWTSPTFSDETMHVQANYFDLQPDDRAVSIIHERAHTVLKLNGHPGSGDAPVCVVPHEGITFPAIAYRDAIRNAYCYEYLSLSLQPTYSPSRFRDNPLCTNPHRS